MTAYYHNLITQKSWEELKNLKNIANFVLIGGWAVYLYTKALKSKDIDIIIDYSELPKLAKSYEMRKNERLKKYEARRDEVQIDIYLPYYSNIGLPVERLSDKINKIEGFTVLNPDYLFVTKLVTFAKRGSSPKGRKDLVDLLSLFKAGVIETGVIKSILKEEKLDGIEVNFLNEVKLINSIEELNLNVHQYSKIKKQILKEVG